MKRFLYTLLLLCSSQIVLPGGPPGGPQIDDQGAPPGAGAAAAAAAQPARKDYVAAAQSAKSSTFNNPLGLITLSPDGNFASMCDTNGKITIWKKSGDTFIQVKDEASKSNT